jgi:hypothetical protein
MRIRIHADTDPGQTLLTQKYEFLYEKYTLCTVGNTVCHKTYLSRYKCLYESLKIRFIC